MSQDQSDVVIDRGKSQWSDLYKKEDYWAIWVGFFFMAIAIIMVFTNKDVMDGKYREQAAKIAEQEALTKDTGIKGFQTIQWYQAKDAQKAIQGQNVIPAVKTIIDWTKTPARWKSNPWESLYVSKDTADAKNAAIMPKVEEAKAAEKAAFAKAEEAQKLAADASYSNGELNQAAATAISDWQKAKKASGDISKKLVKPFNRIGTLIILGIVLSVVCTIGAICMGFSAGRFFIGFWCVYLVCICANILGNQTDMRYYGVNAEIWSIALGMLIANTVGTPKIFKEGAQVEYYIKAGLVLLGAEVLFHKIMAIGVPGIFVAWVVTPIVLISTYIFGQKVVKMPSKTLNIVISSDMSVCGTSAAIATAAACRAKKEELTLSVGLSLTFTAIMMIALPAFIKWVGMPEILGGAWIGGTVDSTGAVAAAGAFLGPKALQVAATVKMIQNVLIGLTAFCVAIYWTTKVEVNSGETVGISEIWNRFPKFVLGFLFVSIVMSIICASIGKVDSSMLVDNGTNKISVPLRGWFFALSFVAIGLTTNFRELSKYFKGGKPLILYVCGQSLNLALTLLMAWIMFYKVFPEITASI